ncbi:DUF1684 domain-containing protein [Natronocalculus amylovorans]|uniref:DUF1684 domain-containing protein n=1 Tax=Natronocalculus amylovorans TaxID=2917812 RepID=A0AAE3FXX6_9EURY|nr:DUF1684 domain-containing protein [Natronocalculus amylovorans]MCL9816679.1 DUF1684 domain-containing protein [Natronocalculus amylovorans]
MSNSFDQAAWEQELRTKRAEKDEFFETHPQSPIPPEKRDSFDGLSYADPDPTFRVTATVTVHEQPEPIEMETSAGPNVRYLRTVTFEFTVNNETYTLCGYKQDQDEAQPIFVPFRDKTTGQQSYEQGRYMELSPSDSLETGDEVTIDFNLAYTPFCAYNEAFSCPLAPKENWLSCIILAGENEPPL